MLATTAVYVVTVKRFPVLNPNCVFTVGVEPNTKGDGKLNVPTIFVLIPSRPIFAPVAVVFPIFKTSGASHSGDVIFVVAIPPENVSSEVAVSENVWIFLNEFVCVS